MAYATLIKASKQIQEGSVTKSLLSDELHQLLPENALEQVRLFGNIDGINKTFIVPVPFLKVLQVTFGGQVLRQDADYEIRGRRIIVSCSPDYYSLRMTALVVKKPRCRVSGLSDTSDELNPSKKLDALKITVLDSQIDYHATYDIGYKSSLKIILKGVEPGLFTLESRLPGQTGWMDCLKPFNFENLGNEGGGVGVGAVKYDKKGAATIGVSFGMLSSFGSKGLVNIRVKRIKAA